MNFELNSYFDDNDDYDNISFTSSSDEDDLISSIYFPSLESIQRPPFNLYKILGCNKYIGIKHVKSDHQSENQIIYASGHAAVIMNIQSRETKTLYGHEKSLIHIGCDKDSKFLVTSDQETVIIWNRIPNGNNNEPIVIRILKGIFGNTGVIHAIEISPCGKYLIIIGVNNSSNGTYELQFWLWSFGNENCDDKFYIDRDYGEIKSIKFSENPNENEFFAITLTHNVLFGIWNQDEKHLKFHVPKTKFFKNITQSCYVTNSRNVVSSTGLGHILLWSDFLISLHNEECISNEKNFIASIRIHSKNYSINDIKMIDNYIVIVDSHCEISFYNQDISLMFICSFWKIDMPILQICPVSCARKYRIVNDEKLTDDGTEIISMSNCPRDCTIKNEPFIVRNFYVVIDVGDVFQCDIVSKLLTNVLYNFGTKAVAVDHHPSKTIFYFIDIEGKISLYEYMKNIQILENRKNFHESTPDILKLSNDGSYLAIGYQNGALWILSATTISPLNDLPVRHVDRKICLIEFSKNSKFCAFTTEDYMVILLKHTKDSWTLIGKHRYHCKKIVNLFFQANFLITIGNDRFFVEYDLNRSIDENDLIVRKDVRLEQSALITAAQIIPKSCISHRCSNVQSKSEISNEFLLIANDEYKFRIIDIETAQILFTFLGPIFESPIKQIIVAYQQIFEDENQFLIVASGKHLGVVLTPIDGNPFRYTGTIGHPTEIKTTTTISTGDYVLVLGDGDDGRAIWQINKKNIIDHYTVGGTGLTPFRKVLPEWLFDHMQEIFYFMQIIDINGKGEKVSDKNNIKVSNLINFMRAVGYFPSEYDIKNLLKEANYRSISEYSEITFHDTIEMYVNHKPVYSYKICGIENSIKYLLWTKVKDYSVNENPTNDENKFHYYKVTAISMEKLLSILTEDGEKFTKIQAMKFLIQLLHENAEKNDDNEKKNLLNLDQLNLLSDEEILNEFEKLPSEINIKKLCKILLGIESNYCCKQEFN